VPDNIIIKTPEQIAGIRKSCQLAAQCLEFIQPHVQPGVTTARLGDLLEEYIRGHKAIPAPKGYQVGDLVYPKATCISLNEVICHGVPNETVIQEGDILNIDVTTILDDYYGDTSKMYFVGEVDPRAIDLAHYTQKALFFGIAQVKPGAQIGNIGWAIAHLAHSQGYSVVESFCGHGTGLQFHEPPNVPHSAIKGTGPVLKPGMIFTIEPMINEGVLDVLISEEDGWTARTADGKLSAQYEHTILVTSDGCEILTIKNLAQERVTL